MPGLLKDRATGRLGRLISALRPARAGPLPVQTGFPTSLADLFVKNHGRLRKPSSAASRRKKRGAPPLPTPPSSPAPSPAPSCPTSPPPPPNAVSHPAQPIIPVLPPAEPVFRNTGGGAFGLGLGFLALVGVVSLALLVIWSRKVVAAVTVAAFSLFLLESVRSFSLRRRPRPVATEQALDSGGRGYVSPIREVEPEPEPPRRSFSDSGRGTDGISVVSTEDRIEEGSEAGDDSGNSKAKSRRRSWKKLIPRKLQRGRIRNKEAEDSSPSVSFRSESSEADAALVGGNARATGVSDSRRGSGRIPLDAVAQSSDRLGPRHGDGARTDDTEVRGLGVRPIEAGASSGDLGGAEDVGAGSGNRLPFAAAAIVVLVGLAAGRLPAVAFTVLCSALVGSLQRLSAERRRQLGGR